MGQISAAENLVILFEDNRWRLIDNRENNKQLLLDVVAGEPVRYAARFGSTRRLPADGELSLQAIQRVVLGWSNQDEAWHLGLVVEAELAQSRNSRWCEIAQWPDPDRDVFGELGKQAGESLAETLTRPFSFIPPKFEDRPVEEEASEILPLPDLPLHLGLWTARRLNPQTIAATSDSGPIEFKRASSWVVSHITRIIWYSLLVVAYLVLSFSTLTGTLALPNSGTMLPNPIVLPYLGIATALVLIGIVVYLGYELFDKPDRIIVDADNRVVSALRGNRVRWQYSGEGVQSVYVTQVVGKKANPPRVDHGELNLHFGGDQFHKVIEIDKLENNKRVWKAQVAPGEDGLVRLTGAVINTDLQAAGLYVAAALGDLPCWYDQRHS